jgi:hypothetical protein
MTTFPNKIVFKSDGSHVELVGVLSADKKSKDPKVLATYRYTKVHKDSPNKGREFTMSIEYINRMIGYKLIEVK